MDLFLGFIHPILPPNVEEEQEVPQEPPVPTAENVEIAPVADVAVIPGAAVLTTNVEMQEAAEEPPTLTTENVETSCWSPSDTRSCGANDKRRGGASGVDYY